MKLIALDRRAPATSAAIQLCILVCSACLLSACGSGRIESVRLTPAPGSEPPAGPPPGGPPAGTYDCTTAGPARTTDTDALPGGIWAGAIFDCQAGAERTVLALISEDGRFRIFSTDESSTGDLLQGSLSVAGDTFAANGAYFFSDGSACSDCWATGLFADGVLSERDRLEGRWSADWGSYGAGCSYTGTALLADQRYNLYDVTIRKEGCPDSSVYRGFTIRQSGPFNDRLWVSVDDGHQRALRLLLYSE